MVADRLGVTGPCPLGCIDEPVETFAIHWKHLRDPFFKSDPPYFVFPIGDNDPGPTLSIEDAQGDEDDFSLEFPVSLTVESGNLVTVAYSTADGTATAGADYAATSGTLTFEPGEKTKAIRVPVLSDDMVEADETFTITLSNPTDATIPTGEESATGTIMDVGATKAAELLVADSQAVDEGGELAFAVRLSGEHTAAVEVDFETVAGTATAGSDYTEDKGTLTFPVGTRNLTVEVETPDDPADEPEESMSLMLSNPSSSGTTIRDDKGTGTVRDNDPPPTVSVAAAIGTEGGDAGFEVTLHGATQKTVAVTYWTSCGTAEAETDFGAAVGRLTFAPGTTVLSATVMLREDSIDEDDETFTLDLWVPENATLGTSTATGTVIDNDDPPSLSIMDASARESKQVVFEVKPSEASARRMTVTYATADGTASGRATGGCN